MTPTDTKAFREIIADIKTARNEMDAAQKHVHRECETLRRQCIAMRHLINDLEARLASISPATGVFGNDPR